RDGRGLVRGTLVNHLPFPLSDCRLLHAGWLYDIGDFEPGETFDTEAGRGPRSLAAALTRRIAVGDRDRAERWDTASLDVVRILEVAGFHAAAGGGSTCRHCWRSTARSSWAGRRPECAARPGRSACPAPG
ncbi:MAG: hypothetical protein EBX35_12590, partial [Planctomycetia bacterium]|nr:hypothetical protein [Planctomycetia bacterium]